MLVEGIGVTVGFTAAIVVLGILVGLLAGLMMLSRYRLLRSLAVTYIELFRGTPVLVQLVWFYYALPILSGLEISGVTAGILTDDTAERKPRSRASCKILSICGWSPTAVATKPN